MLALVHCGTGAHKSVAHHLQLKLAVALQTGLGTRARASGVSVLILAKCSTAESAGCRLNAMHHHMDDL